jgi:glycosyltransferase involved in cell wall biosynthesis
MPEIKLSALIITYNEEANISRCIKSLQPVADEIVVLDSYSTDKTPEICRKLGVAFYQHAFDGYSNQKNRIIKYATHSYLLSVDADEVLSAELQESILNLKNNWEADACEVVRCTQYLGKWIRHSGWYPDVKLRLWKKGKARWSDSNVHERLELNRDSAVPTLSGDLLHYSYQSIDDHINQINKFTRMGAEEDFKKQRTVLLLWHLLLAPVFFFWKRLIVELGFLDGYPGFVLSVQNAYYKWLKYLKLYELNRNRKKR